MPRICFLIIGYKRLDSLIDNIKRCQFASSDANSIYISIDGPHIALDDRTIKLSDLESIRASFSKYQICKVNKISFNLGPDLHIPRAIDWAFEENDGVIVIEDDVKLSPKSIGDLGHLLAMQLKSSCKNPIVSMSAVGGFGNLPNFWRQTPYFTAWGYGLTRDFWSLHKKLELEMQMSKSVDAHMKGSDTWRKFSKKKKAIWRERFIRGNYDYRIQATLFHMSLGTKAPVFRMSDNVGHSDNFSTHTGFTKPRYLKKELREKKYKFAGEIHNKLITKVLILADSNTWAGDGWLSVRGRPVGFRTLLRKIISVIRK